MAYCTVISQAGAEASAEIDKIKCPELYTNSNSIWFSMANKICTCATAANNIYRNEVRRLNERLDERLPERLCERSGKKIGKRFDFKKYL